MPYSRGMQIGELGRKAGVAAKTIRYYEEIGLLPEPERAANDYRDYEEDSVDRLRFIRDAQATGLSLTEIASILDLRDRGEQTCGHVIGLLEQHLTDIDRQIAQLRETRNLLTAMSERAKRLDPAECADPNRCQTISPDAVTHEGLRPTRRRVQGSPSVHHAHATQAE